EYPATFLKSKPNCADTLQSSCLKPAIESGVIADGKEWYAHLGGMPGEKSAGLPGGTRPSEAEESSLSRRPDQFVPIKGNNAYSHLVSTVGGLVPRAGYVRMS
ncbi:unnamed protein product, partial [Pleuronectes platessa]